MRYPEFSCHWVLPVRWYLLTLYLLLNNTLAVAQNPAPGGMTIPNADQQTELFRGLLHFHDIEPESLRNLKAGYDYSNLIVVILGDPGLNSSAQDHAQMALRRGGAVLIANNRTMELSRLFPNAGQARISGTIVEMRNTLGIVGPSNTGGLVSADGAQLNPFPFQRIELESTSYLNDLSSRLVPLLPVLNYPKDAVVRELRRGTVLPFAAVSVGTQDNNPYRFVALAGQSPLTNKMIYGSARSNNPNENLLFANCLVEFLKGPEGRSKCLFIEQKIAIQKFDDLKFSAIPLDPPAPPMPMPDILDMLKNEEVQRQLADRGNSLLRDAEANNSLNNRLAPNLDRRAALYATLTAIAAVFVYLALRFRSLGKLFLRTFRPIPKDPYRLGPDTIIGSLEHRRLELLRNGDYSKPVQSYVRQLFEERGLPAGYTNAKLPAIEFDIQKTANLAESIHELWKTTIGGRPIELSHWKKLEPMLAAVRAAANEDRWWFNPDEGAA
jgi:hypothetical protein